MTGQVVMVKYFGLAALLLLLAPDFSAGYIPTKAEMMSIGKDTWLSKSLQVMSWWDMAAKYYKPSLSQRFDCVKYCEENTKNSDGNPGVPTEPAEVAESLSHRNYDTSMSSGETMNLETKDASNNYFSYFDIFGPIATCRQKTLSKPCGKCKRCDEVDKYEEMALKEIFRTESREERKNGVVKVIRKLVKDIMMDCIVTAFLNPRMLESIDWASPDYHPYAKVFTDKYDKGKGQDVKVSATTQNGNTPFTRQNFKFAERVRPAWNVNDVGQVNKQFIGTTGLGCGESWYDESSCVKSSEWEQDLSAYAVNKNDLDFSELIKPENKMAKRYTQCDIQNATDDLTWGYKKCAPVDSATDFKIKLECPTQTIGKNVEFLGQITENEREFKGRIRVEHAMYGRNVAWIQPREGEDADELGLVDYKKPDTFMNRIGANKRCTDELTHNKGAWGVPRVPDPSKMFNHLEEPLVPSLVNYSCMGIIDTKNCSFGVGGDGETLSNCSQTTNICSHPKFPLEVESLCEGAESECEIDVKDFQAREGDPCLGTLKYAEINYWCVYEDAVDLLFQQAASTGNGFPGDGEAVKKLLPHLATFDDKTDPAEKNFESKTPRCPIDHAAKLCEIFNAANTDARADKGKKTNLNDIDLEWCTLFRNTPSDLYGTDTGSVSLTMDVLRDAQDEYLDIVSKHIHSKRAGFAVAHNRNEAWRKEQLESAVTYMAFLGVLYTMLHSKFKAVYSGRKIQSTGDENENEVTRDQFADIFRQGKTDTPVIDAQKLAAVADMDRFYAEALILQATGNLKTIDVHELFDFLDKDGDGNVSKDELRDVLFKNFTLEAADIRANWLVNSIKGLPTEGRPSESSVSSAGELVYSKRGYQRMTPTWTPAETSPYYRKYFAQIQHARVGSPSYRHSSEIDRLKKDFET